VQKIESLHQNSIKKISKSTSSVHFSSRQAILFGCCRREWMWPALTNGANQTWQLQQPPAAAAAVWRGACCCRCPSVKSRFHYINAATRKSRCPSVREYVSLSRQPHMDRLAPPTSLRVTHYGSLIVFLYLYLIVFYFLLLLFVYSVFLNSVKITP